MTKAMCSGCVSWQPSVVCIGFQYSCNEQKHLSSMMRVSWFIQGGLGSSPKGAETFLLYITTNIITIVIIITRHNK